MKTIGLGIVGSGYMGRTYAHCVRDHNEGAELVVQTVLDSIVEALNSDDKVELRGFGSFGHRKRNPRQRRNPKTGEAVQVPAKQVPYFRPGMGLKELINS